MNGDNIGSRCASPCPVMPYLDGFSTGHMIDQREGSNKRRSMYQYLLDSSVSSSKSSMHAFADKILNMIGEGTFGRVLECWDRQTRTIVAVKVIRSVPKLSLIHISEPTRPY